VAVLQSIGLFGQGRVVVEGSRRREPLLWGRNLQVRLCLRAGLVGFIFGRRRVVFAGLFGTVGRVPVAQLYVGGSVSVLNLAAVDGCEVTIIAR
jgi:hypothetical protein